MKVQLDKGAYLPEKAHAADAGYDLRSPVDAVVPAAGSVTIDTGVHLELPAGVCGLLVSKSGLNVHHSVKSTGLIDSGYTGSIVVKLYNYAAEPYIVKAGDKISQIVLLAALDVPIIRTDRLPDTERGSRGFGSTGK